MRRIWAGALFELRRPCGAVATTVKGDRRAGGNGSSAGEHLAQEPHESLALGVAQRAEHRLFQRTHPR